MKTIQIDGVDFVSSREIEATYKLTRKRCWQELQTLSLDFLEIAQLRFYERDAIKNHFDNIKIRGYKKRNTILLNKIN